MRRKNPVFSYATIILGCILLLSFLFRFYNFNHFLFFGMDQEYEAFLVKNILSGQHFPLIGVNASDTGLYLGPAFIYLATIPFAFFGGNPVGWGITASLLGVLTTCVIFKIGKSLFSERIGLLSSFFYAASFLISFYDRNFWNPTPVALLSIIMGYLIIKFSEKIPKYMPILFSIFGIGIQCHLSLVLFFPLIVFTVWKERKRIQPKTFILSLAIFTLLQIPLIFFDFRHNFTNSKAFIHLFTQSSNVQSHSTILERGNLFISSVARFLWFPASSDMFAATGQCSELSSSIRNPPPEMILTGLIILGVFLLIFLRMRMNEKKKNHIMGSYMYLYRLLLITLFILIFFSRRLYEYYFLYFFPYLSIIFAVILDRLWKNKNGKRIGFFILFIFLLHNSISLFTSFSSYSYQDKIDALTFAKKIIGKNSYSLEAFGECPRFGGYRYLSEYVIGSPNSSYMDSYFSWLYPSTIKKTVPKYTLLFSLIDPRSDQRVLSSWQEKKYQYLENYDVAVQQQFNSIQILILTPRL